MLIEQPGLYKNIPINDYHASPGISNTGMGILLDCPKRYWYEYLSGKAKQQDKKEYTIGSAVHALVLEPDTFDSRFHIIKEKFDRRTTVGKEAYKHAMNEAAGKIILDVDDYEKIHSMAESVRAHKHFPRILSNGEIENSIMWQDKESGALLRTRPDFYNDYLITDLKTTSGSAKNYFTKSMAEYGYHRQAAMACDGLIAETGNQYDSVVLFVVEDYAPYLCVAYLIKDRAIELGRAQYKEGAKLYQECSRTNNWPGYEEDIQEIDLPEWYYGLGESL